MRLSGPDRIPYVFIVDEYTTIKELRKYISRYLGLSGMRVIAEGDIVADCEETHSLPSLHLALPMLGGGGDTSVIPPDILKAIPGKLGFVMYRCRYDFV